MRFNSRLVSRIFQQVSQTVIVQLEHQCVLVDLGWVKALPVHAEAGLVSACQEARDYRREEVGNNP